jgi:hypothetical protein
MGVQAAQRRPGLPRRRAFASPIPVVFIYTANHLHYTCSTLHKFYTTHLNHVQITRKSQLKGKVLTGRGNADASRARMGSSGGDKDAVEQRR